MVVLGATVFAALAIALVLPKNYVASTAIPAGRARRADADAGAAPTARERAGYLQAQMDLIQSSKGGEARGARRDSTPSNPGVRERTSATPAASGNLEDWAPHAAEEGQRPNSSAATSSPCRSPTPTRSSRPTSPNGFAKAYDRHLARAAHRADTRAATWFEAAETLRHQRVTGAAEADRLNQRGEKGITSTEERTMSRRFA